MNDGCAAACFSFGHLLRVIDLTVPITASTSRIIYKQESISSVECAKLWHKR